MPELDPYCYRARLTPGANHWDGDTIRIDIDQGFDDWKVNQAIRLARIDAPERKGDTKAAALLARDYLLNDLIGMRPFLVRTIQLTGRLRGKYGRFLLEVYVETENGWENANDLMVKAGHARYATY